MIKILFFGIPKYSFLRFLIFLHFNSLFISEFQEFLDFSAFVVCKKVPCAFDVDLDCPILDFRLGDYYHNVGILCEFLNICIKKLVLNLDLFDNCSHFALKLKDFADFYLQLSLNCLTILLILSNLSLSLCFLTS